ncbi:hypothetical protein MRB53_033976 [Persea americana]|uniref:Uncharacterized protein n=1 Tax=Persea americana TaxID=3435 RepID=A0ACC2KX36_PERAE|nr:hypothetical protein MRB53_033976 [Persea americana]
MQEEPGLGMTRQATTERKPSVTKTRLPYLGVWIDPDAEEGAGGEEEAAEGSVGGEGGPPFKEVARVEQFGDGALNEPEPIREGEGAEGAAAEPEVAEVAGEEGGGDDGEYVVRERVEQPRATQIIGVAGTPPFFVHLICRQ